MYLSDLLSSPEYKSSKHDFIFKTSISWLKWRKFLPCKTFLPYWPAKTVTIQVFHAQYISFLDSVLFLVPSHMPLSLASNLKGLLKFSVLLKHRNKVRSDHRVLQRSASLKALEYTWGKWDKKFNRLDQGHTGGKSITSPFYLTYFWMCRNKIISFQMCLTIRVQLNFLHPRVHFSHCCLVFAQDRVKSSIFIEQIHFT